MNTADITTISRILCQADDCPYCAKPLLEELIQEYPDYEDYIKGYFEKYFEEKWDDISV